MAARSEYRGIVHRNNADLKAWLAKRPTEAAIEPDLPIIDPHHHLWDTPHRGTYLLPELLADLSGGHKIVSTVFLECQAMFRAAGPVAMKPVGEVEFVNGVAAMSASGNYGPARVCEAIVGWADLALGAPVRDVLEAEIRAGNGRMRGVRFGTSWDASDIGKYVSRTVPQHQLLDPKFREGFSQLAKLGLTFDSWQYFPQMPDLIDLARAFPETTIIMDHVGGMLGVGPYADRPAEIKAQWLGTLAEIAKCPNVNVKLGGAGMTSFGFDFHDRDIPPSSQELAAAWRPYIEPCIDLFGVDRCMFESNFPPDKQSCGYTELWNAFKHITSGASATERTALYSGTAARVYKLEKP
jgi:predicted TIM-barrel fold metal-dependent hydrolase